MSIDRRIAEIAARQHLAVGRWQLSDAGLTKHAIDHRLAKGRLFPLVPGAYALVPDPPFLTRLVGALVCHRSPSVASHDAALFLAGLTVEPPTIEITVPRTSGRRSTRRVVVHHADVQRPDVVRLQGVPSTAPTRAILDVAARYDEPRLTALLDAARVARVLDVEGLLARCAGRPGGPLLRDILTDGNAARAERERDAERLLVEAGLPRPERNVRIGAFEYDLVWRAHRFVVELDSRTFHGAGDRVERDREKERNLRRHRCGHLRFTHRQVAANPGAFVAEVAGELARRSILTRSGVADAS